MRELIYRPRAAFDLESIVVYVGQAQKAPQAARSLYNKIKEAAELLCETPEIGKPFADERLDQNYRSWLVGTYRIFYTFSDGAVTIWRIIHTRQDIGEYGIVGLE